MAFEPSPLFDFGIRVGPAVVVIAFEIYVHYHLITRGREIWSDLVLRIGPSSALFAIFGFETELLAVMFTTAQLGFVGLPELYLPLAFVIMVPLASAWASKKLGVLGN
jgi:hypothetical protein